MTVSEYGSMHSAFAAKVTPLLGSLGLHGGIVVLAVLVAARHPRPIEPPERTRPDSWAGNAVEVDAVATAGEPSLPSAPAAAQAAVSAAAEPENSESSAPPEPKPTEKSSTPSRAVPARRHAARTEKPSDEQVKTPAASMASGSDGSGAPASGAFGGHGLPAGVRGLPTAFTRAIPPAVGADSIWQSLPLGVERPFTIAVEVDAEGHISSAEILKEKDGSEAPVQADHLRTRVVALLGGGLFALQNDVGAGQARFRITLTISNKAIPDDADPAQLVERGFDPPRGGVGRAYFTLASGRHVEAKVEVLASRAAR